MATKLSPYLNFRDQTKAAMNFYHGIFGGNLKMQSYADAGMGKDTEKMMHAELSTDMFTFFSSDGGDDRPVHPGDSVHMCLVGEDEKQLTEFFNKLADGGRVDMPLAKQFWGDTYGQLTDKFGIHWMVNISAQ